MKSTTKYTLATSLLAALFSLAGIAHAAGPEATVAQAPTEADKPTAEAKDADKKEMKAKAKEAHSGAAKKAHSKDSKDKHSKMPEDMKDKAATDTKSTPEASAAPAAPSTPPATQPK